MQIIIRKKAIYGAIQNFVITCILVLSVLVTFYDKSLNMPFYYIIIFAAGYYYVIKEKCVIRKDVLPLLIYGTLTIGSTFFNGFIESNTDFVQDLWKPIRILSTAIIGYYYFKHTTEYERKKLYRIIYILILVSVAYGFYQNIMGIGWGYNSRMDSFFGHPIAYGSILIFAFWLTPYLIHNKWSVLILNSYIVLGLLSSKSRSAWIALAVSIIIFVSKRRKATITKRAFISYFIVFIAVFAFLFTPTFQSIVESVFSRFSGTMKTASATQRLGSYIYIFEKMIGKNPIPFFLGHGEGSANRVMAITTITLSSFATTDCQYLTILYNYGIVGLGLVLLLVAMLIKSYYANSNDNELEMICLSVFGGGYITAIFYDIYGWLSISTLLMLFIGFYLAKRSDLK